jgi:gliding motility-associated-like protein
VSPSNEPLKWDESPDLSNLEIPNPVATPTMVGTVTYNVSATEAACPSGSSITIEVKPGPPLNLPVAPQLCFGQSIQLNNAVVDTAATYSWTSNPAGFTSMEVNPEVTPTQTTTYNVTATAYNCTVEREVVVTVFNATVDAGEDATICAGESTQLEATVQGSGGGQFSWLPQTYVSNPGSATTSANPPVTQVFNVLYVYGNNCQSTDDVTVTVLPGITGLGLVPTEVDSLCEGEKVLLNVVNAPAGSTFRWFENDTPIANQTADSLFTELATPGTADGNVATITVEASLQGCEATATATVNVFSCLDVPTAFTPNGDEFNGVFKPVLYGVDAAIVDFAIYSRWGQQVFHATGGSALSTGWDGRVDGKDAPTDVYVYVLRVRYNNGREETRQGEVALIR